MDYSIPEKKAATIQISFYQTMFKTLLKNRFPFISSLNFNKVV